jgi:preprotein translocase subunit Sss1
MAFKSIFASSYLPFHKKAANKPWDEIEESLKYVILSLIRLGGLGFLIISILLIVCTGINFFVQGDIYKYAISGIALIYCAGLSANNYLLYKNTKVNTPWKGPLYAICLIQAGIILSIFN